jgi:nucleoside-diphosphate-sugar epimerase
VPIINIDKSAGGYGLAKMAHKDAWRLAGAHRPRRAVPRVHDPAARVGAQGDVAYVPKMRTQIVSARTVAEVIADVATSAGGPAEIVQIAGPREEDLAQLATMLAARRGTRSRSRPYTTRPTPTPTCRQRAACGPARGYGWPARRPASAPASCNRQHVTSQRAERELGVTFRPLAQTIADEGRGVPLKPWRVPHS